MEHPFWFYGKFLSLLGIVSLMAGFNFFTWGFHSSRQSPVWHVADAHPERGPALVRHYGCSACHAMPGSRAAPQVGPSLVQFQDRMFIAGKLSNTPGNVVRWIRNPEQIRPGTAMPNLQLKADDARDITAFLFNPTMKSDRSARVEK